MCSEGVKQRLIPVLEKLELPLNVNYEAEKIIEAASHDKKKNGEYISVVYVEKIGTFEFKNMPFSEFVNQIEEVIDK